MALVSEENSSETDNLIPDDTSGQIEAIADENVDVSNLSRINSNS